MSDVPREHPAPPSSSRRSFISTTSRVIGAAVVTGNTIKLRANTIPAPPDDEILLASAYSLAQKIRTKQIKSVEVVKAYLD